MTGQTLKLPSLALLILICARQPMVTSCFYLLFQSKHYKMCVMHLSNGSTVEWFDEQWNIREEHSIHPTGYTDTQYVHRQVIMRNACHLCRRFIPAWTVTASQTLRSPGQPKHTENWMRPDKQPEEAKQTHASKQQDGGHSKPALYALPTDYPLATSPPVWGEGD